MKIILTTLLLASALLATELHPQCAKPIGNANADLYKACIDDFIREHKQKRQEHTKAVNNAINEWNDFVAVRNGTKKQTRTFTGSTGVPIGGAHTVGHSDESRVTTGFKF